MTNAPMLVSMEKEFLRLDEMCECPEVIGFSESGPILRNPYPEMSNNAQVMISLGMLKKIWSTRYKS